MGEAARLGLALLAATALAFCVAVELPGLPARVPSGLGQLTALQCMWPRCYAVLVAAHLYFTRF